MSFKDHDKKNPTRLDPNPIQSLTITYNSLCSPSNRFTDWPYAARLFPTRIQYRQHKAAERKGDAKRVRKLHLTCSFNLDRPSYLIKILCSVFEGWRTVEIRKRKAGWMGSDAGSLHPNPTRVRPTIRMPTKPSSCSYDALSHVLMESSMRATP